MVEMYIKGNMVSIEDLIESWRLAKGYEDDDLDQWASDIRLFVLNDLKGLPIDDRKLFWERVNSAQQNGN